LFSFAEEVYFGLCHCTALVIVLTANNVERPVTQLFRYAKSKNGRDREGAAEKNEKTKKTKKTLTT